MDSVVSVGLARPSVLSRVRALSADSTMFWNNQQLVDHDVQHNLFVPEVSTLWQSVQCHISGNLRLSDCEYILRIRWMIVSTRLSMVVPWTRSRIRGENVICTVNGWQRRQPVMSRRSAESRSMIDDHWRAEW